MTNLKVALIGNPNCGKSTVFNALTGLKQTIGNWPGVTVEKKVGNFEHEGMQIEVIDLPGIYSFHHTDSLDEKIARDFLTSNNYDLIINIVDSSNIQRHLYLTLQLLEIGAPIILALNMSDVAEKKGICIQQSKLEEILKVKTIKLTAYKNIGIDDLKSAVIQFSPHDQKNEIINKIYPSEIYDLIHKTALQEKKNEWEIIQYLEYEPKDSRSDLEEVVQIKNKISDIYSEESSIIIPGLRYEFIYKITNQIIIKQAKVKGNITNTLDKIFLNKLFGIPIFLFIIYCAFTFSIVIGGAFQDFFELASEVLFVDIPRFVLDKLNAPALITFILADCIGHGIQIVLTFVPIIGGLYLFLSFLEDSGYLQRGAYLIDRSLKAFGLPGKAFFPLIIGFGCNVPSIMATRIIKNSQDRIAVALVAPFMSCGARLSVYALFCAAFFPHNGQNIVFSLYIIGIVFGLLTGLLLKKTILQTKEEHLVLELVDYHVPTLKNLFIKMLDSLKAFVFGAGKLIVIVSVILQCLNSLSFDLSTGNESNGKSIIAVTSKKLTPIFEPIGIKQENWPASVGLITGIFAKEVVVGTLNSLYLSMSESDKATDIKSMYKKTILAFESIPENLSKIKGQLLKPLWLNLSDQGMVEEYIDNEGVSTSIYQAMRHGFDGKIGAFAYLLFILLYFPCVSVFGILAREIGLKWAIFSAVWSTSLAYLVSLVFYQGSKLLF